MGLDSVQVLELLWEPPCEPETLRCLCPLSSWLLPWGEHRFWRRRELGASSNYGLSD